MIVDEIVSASENAPWFIFVFRARFFYQCKVGCCVDNPNLVLWAESVGSQVRRGFGNFERLGLFGVENVSRPFFGSSEMSKLEAAIIGICRDFLSVELENRIKLDQRSLSFGALRSSSSIFLPLRASTSPGSSPVRVFGQGWLVHFAISWPTPAIAGYVTHSNEDIKARSNVVKTFLFISAISTILDEGRESARLESPGSVVRGVAALRCADEHQAHGGQIFGVTRRSR